jgi:chromatin remodeling complex protein RSC6
MSKTTTTKISAVQATKFSREKERLERRLAQLLTEARSIEDALDVPSRILAAAPTVEVVGVPQGAVTFEEPRGKIMRTIWQYIIKHPGQTSIELRDALKMDTVQMATALNTLLRKNQQVQVRGTKGAYRYYAVTARK